MNFLKLIFSRSAVVPQPVKPTLTDNTNGAGGTGTKIAPATDDDRNVKLAVAKAMGQLSFISRSYGFTLCDNSIDDLKTDLETMLRYNDLKSIRIELLGGDGRVLFEFKLHFSNDRAASRIIDTGQGVELPMLDRTLVTGKRLVLEHHGLQAAYKHLLGLNWRNAPVIAKAAGTAYDSDHAAKISGGRQRASFHVGDAARHRFTITQTGTKGFGFAKELGSGRDGVFVLAKQLPPEVQFAVGAQFAALLVQTPRGLQVRSVQAA